MPYIQSKLDEPTAMRAMHLYPEVAPLMGQRVPNQFEQSYCLERIGSVRGFTADCLGVETAAALWDGLDSISSYFRHYLANKGIYRRGSGGRRNRDRTRSVDLTHGVLFLEEAMVEYRKRTAGMSLDRQQLCYLTAAGSDALRIAAGLPPEYQVQFFPDIPGWCRCFFGNGFIAREIPSVNGSKAWRRATAYITHPLLIECGIKMCRKWAELALSAEFKEQRLARYRNNRISKILNAATQGVQG